MTKNLSLGTFLNVYLLLRYVIDPNKLSEFEEYARAWIPLIEIIRWNSHGYFVPAEQRKPFQSHIQFPGV